MFRKLGLLLTALAFFSIAGGQWAAVQTVAWAGMLHDYAQSTGSVTTAVAQTFDGRHPCKLCLAIALAKASEHKQESSVPGAKDDAKVKAMVAPVAVLTSVPPPQIFSRLISEDTLGPNRAEEPPTPPPRRGTSAA